MVSVVPRPAGSMRHTDCALTLAAVTLRVYLPVSLVAGVEFETAYRAIA